MSLRELRQAIKGEIFDYPTLMYYLREYQKPRDKVTQLLKEGEIIRVKKGIYVFGSFYRKELLSLESLAQALYSPSYLSLEYALSKYGLIPEKSFAVTSVCLKRTNQFKTEFGLFIYKKRPVEAYPLSILRQENGEQGAYLIATREKALVDFLYENQEIRTVSELREFLYENMRMEPSELKKLNRKLLSEILDAYQMSKLLLQVIYDE